METIIIKGNWIALSPIHHGGSENFGTTTSILQMPILCVNSKGEEVIEHIPCIHGNAVRGMLRRLVMQDFLELLDYDLNSKKVYHFLFTGGILEAIDKKDKGAINLDLKKKIRDNLIPISLFGSALGNQMFNGKMKVGMGNLCCSETAHYYNKGAKFGAYNLRSQDFGTRKDDLQCFTEDKEKKDKQNTQMIYDFETIISGAKFMHEFVLEDCTDLEKSCFIRMLQLWKNRPYIGGKSGSGYGKISFEYDESAVTPSTENLYLGDYYKNWVQDYHKDEITDVLDELVQRWK